MLLGKTAIKGISGIFILNLALTGPIQALECENGKFFNSNTGRYEICRPGPDLSGCKDLGSRGYINKIRSISGEETELRTYKCGSKLITIYIFLDKTVYGYAVYHEQPKEIQWYWDYDMDGNFESGIKISY
ncbi:MAG: hypothetical protein ABFD62_15450 [Syntrophaceae bacterium]